MKPDLSQMRIFGCLAYASRPAVTRARSKGKLDDRWFIGYNMGPSRHSRGWDIYIPNMKSQYYPARHVRFDERRFYDKGPLDPEARGNYSHPSEYLDQLPRDVRDLANGTDLSTPNSTTTCSCNWRRPYGRHE